MGKKFAIAIDGPAGAGKSTVAKIVAERLGFIYIDTGAMYRAVALDMIRNNIDPKDVKGVVERIKNVEISIELTDAGQVIYLDKENVSHLLRTPEVTIGSSNVAIIPEVRKKMVDLQRKIAERNNVVMEGRDIGTNVLPNADLKIFLTASLDERAMRRYNEIIKKENKMVTIMEVIEDIKWRDLNDTIRDSNPLRIADDAKVIDTTNKSIEEVVNIILEQAKKMGISGDEEC